MTSSRKSVVLAAFAASVSAAALLAVSRPAQGAGDDGPKPVAEIKDVMLAINAGEESLVSRLKADFAKDKLDDDGWEVARARASMVMEAGNVLFGLKPPMGDEAAWRKHVAEYRGCADQAREAANKKDAAAGKAALAGLGKRCNECHKDHRKSD